MNNDIHKDKNIVLLFFNEFIRIKNVIVWSTISFSGFILGMSSLELSSYMIPLFVFLVSTFCILSFTFAINNYYDADSDRENPRRKHINAIASGKISKQTGVFLNIMLIIIPLVVSFLFKLEVFLFCVVFIIWMWIYSSPPLRLKGRPGLDIIWHFFAFFIFIMWGSLIAGSVELINWLVAISVGIFSCIGQIENHISDYSFDKDSGTKTLAVWVGLDTAKTTLKIFIILHMIFLIPLVLLYSLNYILTIVVLIGGTMMGICAAVLKRGLVASPKNAFLEPSVYYFPLVFGGAVYLNCLIYHINFILGEPTIELLNFIGIV